MKTQKINKWLKRQGITKTQIARELGISHVAVVLVIQGKSTSARVVEWLKEHGCPEEYLRKGLKKQEN